MSQPFGHLLTPRNGLFAPPEMCRELCRHARELRHDADGELCGTAFTPAQVAQLLLDEQRDGVELAQRTLAAMLGVQCPSLNKVLEDFERDRLITVRYAAVDVLDPARLIRLAA